MKSQFPIIVIYFIACSFSFGQENLSTTVDSLQRIDKTSIYFDTDRSTLKQTEQNKLDSLAKRIAQYDELYLDINGFADVRGNSTYNLKLSERRAIAVKNSLESSDLKVQSFKINPRGDKSAAYTDRSDHLKKQRRVDVITRADRVFILITGQVQGKDSARVPNAKILYNSETVNGSTTANNEGRFSIYAPAGEDVHMTAMAVDHYYIIRDVKLNEIYDLEKIDFLLPSLEMNKNFTVQNLLFKGNRSSLLPYSIIEIDRLQKLMKVNKDYCFEIAGHINLPDEDSVGINTFHYNLSVARAQAVYDSMLYYGVDEDRLYLNGYANWQMRFPHPTTSEKRQANRRVEIIVRPCEEVRKTQNDTVNVKRDYTIAPVNEKFNEKYLKPDFDYFSTKMRKKIISNVKYLRSKDRDPSQFTYTEILLIEKEE